MSLSDNNDIFITKASEMLDNIIIGPSSPSSFANVTDGGSGDGIYANDSFTFNDTFSASTREYIFDRKDVRYVFVTLYSLVFCFCFFGELSLCHHVRHGDDDDFTLFTLIIKSFIRWKFCVDFFYYLQMNFHPCSSSSTNDFVVKVKFTLRRELKSECKSLP